MFLEWPVVTDTSYSWKLPKEAAGAGIERAARLGVHA
jgi:hypothetical protein